MAGNYVITAANAAAIQSGLTGAGMARRTGPTADGGRYQYRVLTTSAWPLRWDSDADVPTLSGCTVTAWTDGQPVIAGSAPTGPIANKPADSLRTWSVVDLGADPYGNNEDRTSLVMQRIIDEQIPADFGAGIYRFGGVVLKTNCGIHAPNAEFRQSAGASLFDIGSSGVRADNFSVQARRFRSAGPTNTVDMIRNIGGGIAAKMEIVSLYSEMTGARVLGSIDPTYGFYGLKLLIRDFRAAQAATVPPIEHTMADAGLIGLDIVFGMTYGCIDVPIMRYERTDGVSGAVDTAGVFDFGMVEKANGGVLHCAGLGTTRVLGRLGYDFNTVNGGLIEGDCIRFMPAGERDAGAQPCENMTVSWSRHGGTLDTGVSDIFLGDAIGTIMDGCQGQNATTGVTRIDANNQAAVLIGRKNITLVNGSNVEVVGQA